jgi:hypothetical protein
VDIRVLAVRVRILAALTLVVLSWPLTAREGAGAPVLPPAPEAVAPPIAPEPERPITAAAIPTASDRFSRSAWPASVLRTIDAEVFNLALSAAACAVRAGDVEDPSTLTVIDYSKPSSAKRLWVFDLRSRRILYEELVAHGQGSGGNYATQFSNQSETHRTSLGLFVTGETYVGTNGYSLRLDGLDDGVNDHARDRAIVMHGAPYVSDEFVKTNGRLGRSWGCPALRQGIARELIDRVKGGNLVFSYYPDQNWLNASQYLGDCAAAAE